jgi:hypothetical protein
MNLIREYYELCHEGECMNILTEQERKQGNFMVGLMQEAERLNGNGRVYSRDVLMREVANYKKIVTERRALGELDHPDDSVINLKNASHLVVDMWTEGNKVFGKLEMLDTPSGRILKDLVHAGVKLGISSRGLGSLTKKNGKSYVNEDFQLICFDIVSEPSTPDAFMSLTESKRSSNLFTKADKINRAMNDILYKK